MAPAEWRTFGVKVPRAVRRCSDSDLFACGRPNQPGGHSSVSAAALSAPENWRPQTLLLCEDTALPLGFQGTTVSTHRAILMASSDSPVMAERIGRNIGRAPSERGPNGGVRNPQVKDSFSLSGRRCGADGPRSHRGRGLLSESLIGGLALERSVRSVEVVEVLPLLQAVVEESGVVDDDPSSIR